MTPESRELKQRKKQLERVGESFGLTCSEECFSGGLFHYTALPNLFNILESDSLWATATRFSNDSSEEQILSPASLMKEAGVRMDNFLVCLSQKGDCLSQWRGYCSAGGAAIELDLVHLHTYSILHADYDTTHYYETVDNAPLQILYVPRKKALLDAILEKLREIENETKGAVKAYNLLPYLKDATFREETEWRLLFENGADNFSSCVRFRTLRNGAKVPYLVIKCGDVGANFSRCGFDVAEYDSDAACMKEWEKVGEIFIPQGSDQESAYYQLKKAIYRHSEKTGRSLGDYPRIVCQGHLPVKKIILAPTYDRVRLKEEVERFCRSIYWLQDVEVVSSEIPYIPPSE